MKSIRNNAKLTSIIAILILAIVVFVGCNNKNKDTEQKTLLTMRLRIQSLIRMKIQ